MLIDGGLVVTPDDWEVTEGISSCARFEGMRIAVLIGDGFHLSPRDWFSLGPPALRGIGCVLSGSAIPPPWSLRFRSPAKILRGVCVR